MSPNPANKALQEGITHHQAGRAREAAACYARVRTLAPKLWEGHHFGGMAALLLGRSDEAVALFTKALAINPKAGATAVALGLTQLAVGRSEEAEKTLRLAVKLDPRNAEAWDKLALLLKTRHEIEEALACHAEAVRLAPKNAHLWYNQASTLLSTDRILDCQAAFEKALSCDPSHLGALTGRALCLYKTHRVPEAAEAFERVLRIDPRDQQAMSHRLLVLNNLDIEPGLLAEAHRQYGKLVGGEAEGRRWSAPTTGKRLRVALLSGEYRHHSVAFFLLPLLEGAAAADVELLLYHDHGREDAVTERFKKLAGLWRNFAGQLNEVVEKQILNDAPDVLVDLGGHTGANRLAMLARRLAPVQITYLGYPHSTGLQTMDYRFTDAIADPEGVADAWHTEKVVRFSSTAWCYCPPVDAPEIMAGRRPGDGVVFGSFNHFAKVTDAMLQRWAQLLKEVPGSRLVLKSLGLEQPAIAAQVQGRLRAAGMETGRVELHGLTLSARDHLALYSRIQVALDPSPYNGTTTTCEALWMGVPVVTFVGERHAARVGASLLHAIGQDNWVAASWEEYRAIAKRLALEPGPADPCGTELRRKLQASVLMDQAGQAERFWSAIKRCHAERCSV